MILHMSSFLQERFAGLIWGPNCLQRSSADDTSSRWFWIEMGAWKKKYNAFLSGSEGSHETAHECILARTLRPDLYPNCLQRLSADDTSSGWLWIEMGAEKKKYNTFKGSHETAYECILARTFCGPDLGPNCLQMLSADDIRSRWLWI